jgi:hypothetical protein
MARKRRKVNRRKNVSTPVIGAGVVGVLALGVGALWWLRSTQQEEPALVDTQSTPKQHALPSGMKLLKRFQEDNRPIVQAGGKAVLHGVPTYRPIRAVYGNAPASRMVSTGMGEWPVSMPSTVGPYLPQGSTMAYGRLGIARSASSARRPLGAMDPVTAIADAVGSIFNFSGKIAENTAAKKDRDAQIELARQQQRLDLLLLQQSGASSASSERTTIFLVGGGIAALAVLGAIALGVKSSRQKENPRRNGKHRRRSRR